MFMNDRMDAGDIIFQKEMPIDHDDSAGSLHDKLAEQGAALLIQTLRAFSGKRVTRTPQIESEATFAPKLSKSDGRIDWTKSAKEIYDKIRGFNPWPVCWCKISENKLRVFKVRVEQLSGRQGEALDISGDGPLIGAGKKSVRLLEVQPQGKEIMSGVAYLCGHGMQKGDMLK